MRTETARRANRITQRLRELEDTARFAPVREDLGTSFDHGRFRIRAASDRQTRERAYRLVYDLYQEKGYAQPRRSRIWVNLHDALPETVTLVVECQETEEVVAALTVIFDSPIGLPADRLYRKELDSLRRAGRRPAEIVSLGVSPQAGKGSEILVKLFNFVYLLARKIRGATDFVNTVNPRHAGFYRRTLLFKKAGGVRDYDKVGGAPAVLLRLDLDVPEEQVRLEHGLLELRPPRSRTLYSGFHSPEEEPALVRTLSRSLRPMTDMDMRYFFVELSDLLERATPTQRQHLQDCYLAYDFEQMFLTAPIRC